MPSIDLTNYRYGPNPLPIRQGGDIYYKFDVNFDGTPPATFDYTVRMKNAAGDIVKTLSGTAQTNGQAMVPVEITAPATADGGGGAALAFGNYSNHFEVEATDYSTYDQRLCTGRPVIPEDCDCAASCNV